MVGSISGILVIIGVILALAATIVAWIFIVPEKKRAGLNGFFKWVHDLFNFKTLWLEKILKFLYIFETLACLIVGFLGLFSFQTYGWYNTYTVWTGYWGLIVLILGPIIVRILYEFMMLLILQVKNTMEINDKLNAQPGSRFEEKLADAQKKLELEEQRRQERARRKAEEQAARAAYAQQQAEMRAAQQAAQQQYQQQQQQQYGQQQYQQPNGYPGSSDNAYPYYDNRNDQNQ